MGKAMLKRQNGSVAFKITQILIKHWFFRLCLYPLSLDRAPLGHCITQSEGTV